MKICRVSGHELELKIFLSIGEIREEWDSRLPENHCLKSKYWQVLENSDLPQFRFWYVQILEKGEWIGQAAFQIVKVKNNSFNFSGLEPTVKGLVSALLRTSNAEVLVCGNLFRQNHSGFYFSGHQNQEKIFSVVKKLTHWRKGIASPVVALIKDSGIESSDWKSVKASGFKTLAEDFSMNMKVLPGWSTMDDYYQSLTKKYAQRFQKIKKAGLEVERRIITEEELPGYSAEIEKLYSDLMDRQHFRPFQVQAGYFSEMKRILKNDFEIWGYFIENKLVAFSTFHFYGNKEMEIHYIGFDQKANEDHMLYFNILFDGLERAISKGITTLLLGRGGFDAKASLGAEVHKNQHFIWLKPGIFVFLFQLIYQHYQKSEGKIKVERNPFRKSETPASKLQAITEPATF